MSTIAGYCALHYTAPFARHLFVGGVDCVLSMTRRAMLAELVLLVGSPKPDRSMGRGQTKIEYVRRMGTLSGGPVSGIPNPLARKRSPCKGRKE